MHQNVVFTDCSCSCLLLAGCCTAYAGLPAEITGQHGRDMHRPCKRPVRKSRNRINTMLADTGNLRIQDVNDALNYWDSVL